MCNNAKSPGTEGGSRALEVSRLSKKALGRYRISTYRSIRETSSSSTYLPISRRN